MKRLKEKLDELRAADPDCKVFGAGYHEYELLPALTEGEVREVEAQFGVELPGEYRQFLLEVGAGGAGPFYGLFPLVKESGVWRWEGDGGDMTKKPAAAWKHTARWNLDGHPLWDECPDEDDERFDAESFEDAYDEWQERFYEVYWDEQWTDGGICICHHGCALRDWLVVTGPERGNVWHDAMADSEGLSPWKAKDGTRLTFAGWYEQWLDQSLEMLARSR